MTVHSASSLRRATRVPATAVVGLQWGDEGKGKAVDLLASDHDAVVRYNGGANAGHSVVVGGERFALHLIPSGILSPGALAVIANGVAVDPEVLLKELAGLEQRKVDTAGLVVSSRAHVVLPWHKVEDELREDILSRRRAAASPSDPGAVREIGTTKRGIGPCYADKVQRGSAVRVGDLLRPDVLRERVEAACDLKNAMLAPLRPGQPPFEPGPICEALLQAGRTLAFRVRDTAYLLEDLSAQGKRLLFESANGTLLDVDHGTYPFVTGSTCCVAGIGSGAGVPVQRVGTVLGVVKAYSTRVGSGPMPAELHDATADRIRQRGREFGTTTGRPRRVGWLDLVAVRYAAMINGATGLVITLMDVLSGFDEIKVCTAYRFDGGRSRDFPADAVDLSRAAPEWTSFKGWTEEIGAVRRLSDLPAGARRYLDFIQEETGVPIQIVSLGPDRAQTIIV